MENNETLRKQVVAAINWEPLLKTSQINVEANQGVITLTGNVNNYIKKETATNTARNVSGVKLVIENIEVVFEPWHKRTDAEITAAIANAFLWHWDIPTDAITINVNDGCVVLTGTFEWNYQKEAVSRAISNLTGIKNITNNISIVTTSKDRLEKKDIEDAIRRSGIISGKNIAVHVFDNVVTLKGHVSTSFEKIEAERLAWNDPTVMSVKNELHVDCEK